jgi:hypothetical protein
LSYPLDYYYRLLESSSRLFLLLLVVASLILLATLALCVAVWYSLTRRAEGGGYPRGGCGGRSTGS